MAESLITLAIIGVIAALTIPTLMKNYQASQLRSRFIVANKIAKDFGSHLAADKIFLNDLNDKEIQGYFKLGEGKVTPRYKTLHGKSDVNCAEAHKLSGGFNISNGMTIWISKTVFGDYNYSMLVIDTNGVNKPPNRYGWDVFLVSRHKHRHYGVFDGAECKNSN